MPATTTPLDGLLALIETLQARIAGHGADLRRSEALTRYALIDPLLRELGWDTSDPTQVVPEYPVSGGRADYALLVDGRSRIMIEAKNLGEPLDNAISQGISYCTEKGTPYFALTDGEHWRLYETHRPVPVAEKLVVKFGLQDAPAESALAALALWRARLKAGSTGSPPQTMASASKSPAEHYRQLTEPARSGTEPHPSSAELAAEGWQTLASFTPRGRAKPAEVRFPTGEVEHISTWAALIARTVAWLVSHGHLSQNQVPVRLGGRYLVAVKPQHPGARPFVNPKAAGGFHVETNYSGAHTLNNIRLVIKEANCDASLFHLRLRS